MTRKPARKNAGLDTGYAAILDDLAAVITEARSSAVRTVNAVMTAAYWLIGRRIVEHDQAGEGRAAYGEEILVRLAGDLTRRFGRGFSRRNLQDMRLFYQAYPPEEIRQTLSAKSDPLEKRQTASAESTTLPAEPSLRAIARYFLLPWSAYVRLLSVKNENARRFYEAEALRGGWSVRQLRRQIDSQFYERTALSKDKAAMLEKGQVASPDDAAVAHYALDGLPNPVMASEYRTVLPKERELASEIERTRAALEGRAASLPRGENR